MKVIIPAKANSHRVINKNFRPFYDGMSLVEITIKKLKAAGFAAKDIYVSSNSVSDLSRLRLAHKISTLHRDESYCENEMQLTDVIRYVTGQVGNAREVAWAQTTCPTFNQYRECLMQWQQHKHDHDSLCVAFPRSPSKHTTVCIHVVGHSEATIKAVNNLLRLTRCLSRSRSLQEEASMRLATTLVASVYGSNPQNHTWTSTQCRISKTRKQSTRQGSSRKTQDRKNNLQR